CAISGRICFLRLSTTRSACLSLPACSTRYSVCCCRRSLRQLRWRSPPSASLEMHCGCGVSLSRRPLIGSLVNGQIFQEREHTDDDHDHAHDLLGPTVDRQHIDQIKHENNDKERYENTDQNAHDCPHVLPRKRRVPRAISSLAEKSSRSRCLTSAHNLIARASTRCELAILVGGGLAQLVHFAMQLCVLPVS